MKTTKKGFTLIELIVVIAIIGVLAAILVPAMMGYIKKSKIQSGNTAAATIVKACNSALSELEEGDCELNPELYTEHQVSFIINGIPTAEANIAEDGIAQLADLVDYMRSYYDPARKDLFALNIERSVCTYAAAKSGSYYGTYPAILTAKNYDDMMGSATAGEVDEDDLGNGTADTEELLQAFTIAAERYATQHSTGDNGGT